MSWKRLGIILVLPVGVLALVAVLGALKPGQRPGPAPQTELKYQGPQIPVYDKAVLKIQSKPENTEGFTYEATWESGEAPAVISQWYIKSLGEAGWSMAIFPSDLPDPDIQFLEARKGEMILHLSVIRDANSSRVGIIAQFSQVPPEDKEE